MTMKDAFLTISNLKYEMAGWGIKFLIRLQGITYFKHDHRSQN